MAALTCSHIEEGDLERITDLLQKGFPKRSRQFWEEGFTRYRTHSPPAGYPHYGCVLKCDDDPVGVILLIASHSPGHGSAVRVNVSSWFVQSGYRAFASLLVLRATANRAATYLNVSPADPTRSIIEAQGFNKVAQGVFAGVPSLAWPRHTARVSTTPREWEKSQSIDGQSFQLLMDHHRFGCLGLWCEADNGA
ncbi:MAG: hypothetical protein M3N26_07500, partial [Pseudomonadota bacterium]|nr:hypothetical protein [Pseudomonadota bacterium]